MQKIQIFETSEYQRWFEGLRDLAAQMRIGVRLRRVALGNLGDHRSLGGGIYELRVDHGPGYRVYFAWRQEAAIVLLAAGDKSSQERDIRRARELARGL